MRGDNSIHQAVEIVLVQHSVGATMVWPVKANFLHFLEDYFPHLKVLYYSSQRHNTFKISHQSLVHASEIFSVFFPPSYIMVHFGMTK